MEALIAQAGGSATGIASIFMLSKLATWWYRRRVSGLVLLKGRTSLCNELSNDRLLFLDVDSFLEKMPNFEEATKSKGQMVLLYTALKEQVDRLIRAYQKPVVFVSRHHDLLRVLGLKKQRIFFVCASQEAHKKAELMYKNPEEFAGDEAQRLRLLQIVKKDNVKVFQNLADISKVVKQIFRIKNVEL